MSAEIDYTDFQDLRAEVEALRHRIQELETTVEKSQKVTEELEIQLGYVRATTFI